MQTVRTQTALLIPSRKKRRPPAGGHGYERREALRAARDAGIGLHVDGVDLVLEASAPPSAAVLDLLARHKADLIMLLRPGDDGWSAEDWRALLR